MNTAGKRKADIAVFTTFHLIALAAFFVEFHWSLVLLCLGSYALRMFGITAGYHRYFSHKSYKTGRVMQFVMAWLGALATQKGPIWWAARHRHHHKYSDMLEDVHSPLQYGFWQAHMGWIFEHDADQTDTSFVPDLMKFPELRFLDKYYLLPPITYALAIYLIFGGAGLVWGYFVSTVFLFHGTYTINSLCHVFGSQRYVTGDTSRNNFWLALITLGEGWHNNHHYYQHSARQGFYWYEIDLSFYVIKTLSFFGLVTKIKSPPKEVKLGGRVKELLAEAKAKAEAAVAKPSINNV